MCQETLETRGFSMISKSAEPNIKILHLGCFFFNLESPLSFWKCFLLWNLGGMLCMAFFQLLLRQDYIGGGTEFMDGSMYRPQQGLWFPMIAYLFHGIFRFFFEELMFWVRWWLFVLMFWNRSLLLWELWKKQFLFVVWTPNVRVWGGEFSK